jgi:lysozyme
MGSLLPEPSELEVSLLTVLRPETVFQKIAIQQDVQLADVSFWQEEIVFEVMRAAGIAGVIIRAGQKSWVDTKFKVNWQRAKEAKLPRGSYFLYDSRETPRKQAELWWSQIKDDPGELVHVADLEEGYGGAYGSRDHIKEFIRHFLAISGLPDSRLAIYTGYFWWLERIGNDIFFRRFNLWIAWYAPMNVVKVPQPWHESELLLWQYTSSGDGTTYGVSSREIDLNWYCCDLAHYRQRFGLGDAPPDEGDSTMAEYNVRSDQYNMTLRPDHNTGALGTESVPAGITMIADEIWTATQDLYKVINGVNTKVNQAGDKWAHVVKVAGVVKDSWVAIIHKGVTYCNSVVEVTPPPAATFPPEVGLTIGGVTKIYVPKP